MGKNLIRQEIKKRKKFGDEEPGIYIIILDAYSFIQIS